MYYIIKSIPKDKRLALADYINADQDMWIHDDEEKDYKVNVEKSFFESIGYCMEDGAVGAVKGFFSGIFG